MAMEYHDTTVEEYPDMQIPGRLFELRDLIDDSDMSEVYMFGTTSYRGNYGNPSFCLGPADVDIKQIDVGGLIEENLQAFCDCGTADDVRQILGLVQEDELSEDQLEYEEFSYVDKGWCIDGLVESFERIELPEEKKDRSEVVSLTERCNGAKEASQGLDNHGTKEEQYHDMDER